MKNQVTKKMRENVRESIARTELGKNVLAGKVTDIAEVFASGQKIREPWIVDRLLPDLKSEIIFFGGSPGKGGGITRTSTRRTVRMHRSGRRFKISALVVVGSTDYIGLGKATSTEHGIAINKATAAAKLNIIPIKRGCGSWECRCGKAHSVPLKVIGKHGSVQVALIPAPVGIGLCIANEGKKMIRLTGIRDIWTKTEGPSTTRYNYVWAIYNAFRKLNRMKIELPDAKPVKGEAVKEEQKDKEIAELEAESEKDAKEEAVEKPKDAAIARPELEGGAEVD